MAATIVKNVLLVAACLTVLGAAGLRWNRTRADRARFTAVTEEAARIRLEQAAFRRELDGL